MPVPAKAFRTISIPAYILDDNELEQLIERAQANLREADDESPELVVLIGRLRQELAWRNNVEYELPKRN